jgi:adenylate cyclase class IV
VIFEVEKRSLVTKKKLSEIRRLFKSRAKLVGKMKRFSVIYLKRQDFVADPTNPVDLRIRVTNGNGLLTMKYGNWHNSVAREEYEINFNVSEVKSLLNFLRILEFKWGIMTYIKRSKYKFNNLNITLDEYYQDNKNIIEIDRVCRGKRLLTIAEKEIDILFENIGVSPLGSNGMQEFVSYINKRNKWQFDFTKESIDSWYRKWKKYIECVM